MTTSRGQGGRQHRTAVLYLRLSDARDEASTSIARQRADLAAEAKRRGLVVVDEEVDNGFSGGKDRARASKALRMLRDGEADVLLVWKFDRWSRQGIAAVARLVETLDAAPRALFVALHDNLSSDQPAWRIIAGVLAEVARMEADNTRVRVSSFIHHAKAAGRFPGGRPPVGYRSIAHPSGVGRALEPDPLAVSLLSDAARRIIGGETLYAVTKRLNATDLKPPSAPSWSVHTVRSAFTRQAIIGRVSIRVPGTDREDRTFDVIRDEQGDPVQFWEPVIPVELWSAVRAVLTERKASPSLTGLQRELFGGKRLLADLLVCEYCGRKFYADTGNVTPRYTCASRSRGMVCAAPDGGTGGPAVNADRIEAWVTWQLLRRAGDVPLVRPLTTETPALELAEAKESLAAVSLRLGVPAIDDDEADRLMSQHRALRRRVQNLEAHDLSSAKVEILGTGETFGSVWKGAEDNPQRRRELVASAIDHITVRRGVPGGSRFDATRFTIVWEPTLARHLAPDPGDIAPLTLEAFGYQPSREKVLAALREARQNGVAERFGFKSWAAYLKSVLGESPLELDREQRQELAVELAAHGMSTRLIAGLIAASKRSISRDLEAARLKSTRPPDTST